MIIRRLTLSAAFLLLAVPALFGQPRQPELPPLRFDTVSELNANPSLSGGLHCMYPEDQPRPTPPPAGYEPFYISHIGRHGARYPLGETVYTDVLDVFRKASAEGTLTPAGEEFLAAYSEFCPKVAHREGELTRKGQEQHRRIVRQMYRDYPAVFAGPTRAAAVSTHIHRVIVSMFCFLDEARRLDPDLEWDADYGKIYLPYLLPLHEQSPQYTPAPPVPDSVIAASKRVQDSFADPVKILSHWFAAPAALGVDPGQMLYDMHTIYSTFDNLDIEVPQTLWTMFGPEDRRRIWERDNYRWYQQMGRAPGVSNKAVDDMSATVRDFIEKAGSDWRDGVALRLRFTHDSALAPLLAYMDVNGMGAVVNEPSEVKKYWRSYDIPMACNLQLVFFRKGGGASSDGSDILVQVLLNGTEASLPVPAACPGFYRWSDFVSYYSPHDNEAH